LKEELTEIRNRAQQYEEEIAEESQGEDMELMASQVSYACIEQLPWIINTCIYTTHF
jgi:hypothetical protein